MVQPVRLREKLRGTFTNVIYHGNETKHNVKMQNNKNKT